MRNALAIVLVSLLVSACGGVDFTGEYTGTLKLWPQCEGVMNEATLTDQRIVIEDNGLTLDITYTCEGMKADVSGDEATLREKTCPSRFLDGVTSTVTYTGGKLLLTGDKIHVSWDMNIRLEENGKAQTCTAELVGDIYR